MLLEARELSAVVRIEGVGVTVLDGIELAVRAGEIVDIVGPSGSGKSTLLRALALLLPAATGELLLDGVPASSLRPEEWRTRVTLLPQRPVVMPGSVRDNLLMPWRLKTRSGRGVPHEPRMRDALDMLGLPSVGLDREAVRLSVGQQARLAFARVWLTSPRVLLLDEADAALDEDSTSAMTAAVARFAETGGPMSSDGAAAVVRVRHRADDGVATRRLALADGRLEEVAR